MPLSFSVGSLLPIQTMLFVNNTIQTERSFAEVNSLHKIVMLATQLLSYFTKLITSMEVIFRHL